MANKEGTAFQLLWLEVTTLCFRYASKPDPRKELWAFYLYAAKIGYLARLLKVPSQLIPVFNQSGWAWGADTKTLVSWDLIKWADIVLVMEKSY